MNIIALSEAFDHIAKSPSKLKKELLLNEYSKLEGFREILQFAFNPFIVTGLAEKKMNKMLGEGYAEYNAVSLLEMFKFIEKNNTGP
jgi:hypothetical protein